jgi:MFS superfamily sulfate permease-like transporter
MKTDNNAKQDLRFRDIWKTDLLSGFGVSLIALPLCLAIATVSGFPPISGIITVIIGGVFASHFSGSHITVSGPASGLIVINLHIVSVLGDVEQAIAAIALAGVLIFLLGFFKVGKLSDFFSSSVVKGMLAWIGIIIIIKQLFPALGVNMKSASILDSVLSIPNIFPNINFSIAIISGISLLILIIHPILKVKIIKIIPAPLWMLFTAILIENMIKLPPEALMKILNNLIESIQFTNFSKINSYLFWMAIISIAVITSLESLLSTSSMDSLDPLKRKSDLHKDLSAIGTGSNMAFAIGGLPLISEIVRSSAKISPGGKTQWSNFLHAGFLVVCVVLGSFLIAQIPIAALAVMLIMVGFKLASPKQFMSIYKMGYIEFIPFIAKIIGVLLIDPLIGIVIGILVEFMIHSLKGFPISKRFAARYTISKHVDHIKLNVNGAIIFSNYYMSLKKQILFLSNENNLVIDFTKVTYLSSSASTKITNLMNNFSIKGQEIKIINTNHLIKHAFCKKEMDTV